MVFLIINRGHSKLCGMHLFTDVDKFCEFVYPTSKLTRADFKAAFEKNNCMRSNIGGNLFEAVELHPIVENTILAIVEEFGELK